MDQNGDGRLGWQDVRVQVYTVSGRYLGEFRLNQILFFDGDHSLHSGEFQYPYLHYMMRPVVIPGYHWEGDEVIPDNPLQPYFLIPHFEWGHIGRTTDEDWYGHYESVLASHADDSRYTRGMTYAHIFKAGAEVVIQYWFFYPFNAAGNRHEGDWEKVNVVLSSGYLDTARIVRVEYYHHEEVIVARTAGVDYELAGETHPVVYVGGYTSDAPCDTLDGHGTHGAYPHAGTFEDINPLGTDEWVGGDGLHVDFDGYRNVVLLPRDLPRTVYRHDPELTYDPGWQHFAGAWGQPLSRPLPCGEPSFFDSLLDAFHHVFDKLPEPFDEAGKAVIDALVHMLQSELEGANMAPAGPRYRREWERTVR